MANLFYGCVIWSPVSLAQRFVESRNVEAHAVEKVTASLPGETLSPGESGSGVTTTGRALLYRRIAGRRNYL